MIFRTFDARLACQNNNCKKTHNEFLVLNHFHTFDFPLAGSLSLKFNTCEFACLVWDIIFFYLLLSFADVYLFHFYTRTTNSVPIYIYIYFVKMNSKSGIRIIIVNKKNVIDIIVRFLWNLTHVFYVLIVSSLICGCLFWDLIHIFKFITIVRWRVFVSFLYANNKFGVNVYFVVEFFRQVSINI